MPDQVAVFIDFENIVISAEEAYGRCDLHLVMKAAERWGRCILRRAYGDWTRFEQYRHDLTALSLELIQLFHYGAQLRKNAADIQMVVDALETAFTHPDIQVFVLVTGDSDFSAVARKLRVYGKQVVGIGLRRATSEVLFKACDHFILYDNLVEPDARTRTYTLERARHLLLDSLHRFSPRAQSAGVLAATLKQAMLALDPTFDEVTLGFDQFKEFLEDQSDLVELSMRQGTDMLVRLLPSAPQEPLMEQMALYRSALSTAGLRLLDPNTRTEILRDLFELLQEHPGHFTLDQAALQLKARYDANNVLRSRDEVEETVKLLRYAGALEPQPSSWELDPLTLSPGMALQELLDRCESAYIVVLLQRNLIVEPDLVAQLLFGTNDRRARVEHLTRLAREQMSQQGEASALAAGLAWPACLQQIPELDIVQRDLAHEDLDESATLERAQELAVEGMRVRATDFERAGASLLKASRMMCALLYREEPGASISDLKYYLAMYCASAAGAHFYRYAYPEAAEYYLAFFAMARETDPVWEKVRGLVQPMLSYYFTIAANRHGHVLEVQPAHTIPARILIALHTNPDPRLDEEWQEAARLLVSANPTPLRTVLQQLDVLARMDEEIPGLHEVRQILAALTAPEA
jgi:uncharacterized LabA/DUF88 family protein